jgi:transposase
MMGRRAGGQGQFFYAFDLDKVVPADHLVRQIDAVLNLSWVHKELSPYYSHTGRPSIDPVLMVRMLIVGYVFAIRSERRICAEVQVNLAYRWFCRLGIEDRIPDHSVFCRARLERFRESDALRRVFEGVVATCIAAGLVGGEAFSVDASLIKADVDKKKRIPGDQPIAWPQAEEASRSVREYLAALDKARSDEENAGGDDSGTSGEGGREGKSPKQVSLTDPQAAWVTKKGIDPLFAYDANYLIDNKLGIILDAEATRANRTAEIAVAQTMVDRVERRFDLRPQRLADYSNGSWIVQLLPTCPFGINRPGRTASSAGLILSLIESATHISAQRANCSPIVVSLTKAASYLIARAHITARDARSSHGVRQQTLAKSRAISTRMYAITCARLPTPRSSSDLAVNARR